jgi:hypothetical protein
MYLAYSMGNFRQIQCTKKLEIFLRLKELNFEHRKGISLSFVFVRVEYTHAVVFTFRNPIHLHAAVTLFGFDFSRQEFIKSSRSI